MSFALLHLINIIPCWSLRTSALSVLGPAEIGLYDVIGFYMRCSLGGVRWYTVVYESVHPVFLIYFVRDAKFVFTQFVLQFRLTKLNIIFN
jgi:hypothetical protein